jgi:hypothetical protein
MKKTNNMKTKTHLTIASLCDSTSIPSSLVRAVVRQLGGWDSFAAAAADIASHGIDGGFHGFIYHADTEIFAWRNREDIAKMASEQSAEVGTGVIDMIRGFGCFLGSTVTDEEIGSALFAGKNTPDGANVLNALAWYAGDSRARKRGRNYPATKQDEKPMKNTTTKITATITENGNGLPSIGEICYDPNTDTVYTIVAWDGSDRISTHSPGCGNSVNVLLKKRGRASDTTEEEWEIIESNNYGVCVG